MNNQQTKKEDILDLYFTNREGHVELIPAIGDRDSATKVDFMIKPMHYFTSNNLFSSQQYVFEQTGLLNSQHLSSWIKT